MVTKEKVILELLKEGATITFSNGFAITGDTLTNYIDMSVYRSSIPDHVGLEELSEEGVSKCLTVWITEYDK